MGRGTRKSAVEENYADVARTSLAVRSWLAGYLCLAECGQATTTRTLHLHRSISTATSFRSTSSSANLPSHFAYSVSAKGSYGDEPKSVVALPLQVCGADQHVRPCIRHHPACARTVRDPPQIFESAGDLSPSNASSSFCALFHEWSYDVSVRRSSYDRVFYTPPN